MTHFWKNKLAAYLHDPPSKCADIATHAQRSAAALRAAGFSEDEMRAFVKEADWTAASADRFPFPGSQAAGLSCVFDGVRAGFHHPLGGPAPDAPCVLSFGPGREVRGVEVIEGRLEESEQTVQPILNQWPSGWSEEDVWRARFFAHWRLWPQFAAERDARFAFLPADTRLPDHTIWTHNTIVAALAGCAQLPRETGEETPEAWSQSLNTARLRPAFLKFQLGPVQEFIAQARSTRDLWSGSYLISWLMAAGLKALTARFGPDSVIYPNLRNQPLFDLHWCRDLWECAHIGTQTVWQTMRERARRSRYSNPANNPDQDLLTPSLPNVFLAIVPERAASDSGQLVAKAIREEWNRICDSVWRKAEDGGLLKLCPEALRGDSARARFLAHTEKFLNCGWHVLAWPETLGEARQIAGVLPGEKTPAEPTLLERFDAVVEAATRAMPPDHRDPRYYVAGNTGPKDTLNNKGLAWALLSAVSGWGLNAVRQTRDFCAWSGAGWQMIGVAQNKDALTGREEMLFGGSGFTAQLPAEWKTVFRHDDTVGAITLVKRVWHLSWLAEEHGLKAKPTQFPMPNTRFIADHDPFARGEEAEVSVERADEQVRAGKYFAVLALDGDSMGKWVAGDTAPLYRTQFADYRDSSDKQKQGSLEYFLRESDPDGKGPLKNRFSRLLDTRRLVSPSYHLQFSEALSNFALFCAGSIVEAFQGRLIYAGGDDVLAMLPADTALQCASALRTAFRGGAVQGLDGRPILSSPAPGFLSRSDWRDDHGRGREIPFLVPGPAADCSVGIAMAHYKSPLQDVVRAAQAAERRAKTLLGKSAVAVTLLKRSGETIEWGAKWDTGGLEVHNTLLGALKTGVLSSRFPYRLTELLRGYASHKTPLARGSFQEFAEFPVIEVILREFRFALERHSLSMDGALCDLLAGWAEARAGVDNPLLHYLKALLPSSEPGMKPPPDALETPVRALMGLCQTVAFIARNLETNGPVRAAAHAAAPATKEPALISK